MDQTLLTMLAKGLPLGGVRLHRNYQPCTVLACPRAPSTFSAIRTARPAPSATCAAPPPGVIRAKIEGLRAWCRWPSARSCRCSSPSRTVRWPRRSSSPILTTGAAFQFFALFKSAVSWPPSTRAPCAKDDAAAVLHILDELLHADTEENKEDYYAAIIDSVVTTGIAADFITALCALIRRCAVDRLHILGDIFDRGPHADEIIEELKNFPDVDIQWAPRHSTAGRLPGQPGLRASASCVPWHQLQRNLDLLRRL